jgi:hypothetical protein
VRAESLRFRPHRLQTKLPLHSNSCLACGNREFWKLLNLLNFSEGKRVAREVHYTGVVTKTEHNDDD